MERLSDENSLIDSVVSKLLEFVMNFNDLLVAEHANETIFFFQNVVILQKYF